MRQGASLSYLHVDHLGSVDVATNSSSSVVPGSALDYDAYGNLRSGSLTTATSDRTYTGAQQSSYSGLVRMDVRSYDPATGTFIQPDTIVPQPGDPLSFNRYAYANNNALRYVDPSGHRPECGATVGACGNTGDTWGQTQSGANWECAGPGVPSEVVSRNIGYVLDAELAIYSIPVAIANVPKVIPLLESAAGPLAVRVWQRLSQTQSAVGLPNEPGLGESESSTSNQAVRLVPELGRKLDFILGKATGSIHNIQRSQTMASQLGKLGTL